MDKKIEVSLMFDFYGELLNEKQKEIIELFYNQDLSLGEISEILGITRQGVHDHLQRSEKTLYEWENKLGIVKKSLYQKSKLTEALQHLNGLETESVDNKIKITREILQSIIDD